MGKEAASKLFTKDWPALKEIILGKWCYMQMATKLEMEGCRSFCTESPKNCRNST